ncbi:neurexin-1-like isoform X3 [Clavelina lepadiformis]|uniref:neurexin-1-like isoform X3 n=1 Tax=Clavelina lepadiformis TaxID=159417 RepID=UPI004042179B
MSGYSLLFLCLLFCTLELPSASAKSRRNSKRSSLHSEKYIFYGTADQYIKFNPWVPSHSESKPTLLHFKIRTRATDALLFYTQDRWNNFIYIALDKGSIRVRFKYPGQNEPEPLSSAVLVNDDKWHSVNVKRNQTSLSLTVEDNEQFRTIGGGQVTKLVPVDATYVGGFPSSVTAISLALPGAFYQSNLQKFIGSLRDIRMNGHRVFPRQKEDIEIEDPSEPCSENPCQNSGNCYILDSPRRAACDCTDTGYTGAYCETTYTPIVTKFDGDSWFTYDIPDESSIASYSDEIGLSFRTREGNGLLLHTGKSSDYMSLALTNGTLEVIVNLGLGAVRIEIAPNISTQTFADDQWHDVRIARETTRVVGYVDDAQTGGEFLQRGFAQLNLDDKIYVGGKPDDVALPNLSPKIGNFVGCLREVRYNNSKHQRFPLSRMLSERNDRIVVTGDISFSCDTTPAPRTACSFRTPESYLTLPAFALWKNTARGSMEFQFKTMERNGVLVYANARSSDIFAIELFGGRPYLTINLGNGTNQFPNNADVTSPSLSDGRWHHLSIHRTGQKIVLIVDESRRPFEMAGSNRNLDLNGNFTVGGTDFGTFLRPLTDLLNAPWRKGFVGCMKDFKVDKQEINLRSLSKNQGGINPTCESLSGSYCRSNPCENGGFCIEGTNRFICDCSSTSFKGETCSESVSAARFDGGQYMKFPLSKTIQTTGEVISLRFKTSISSGLLFATTSNRTRDTLLIEIISGGKIRLSVNVADCNQIKNCTAPRQRPLRLIEGSKLNDRQWHTVKVMRRSRKVTISVDGARSRALSISPRTDSSRSLVTGCCDLLPGSYNKLEFDIVHLGMLVGSSVDDVNILSSASSANSDTKPFAGFMENVVFNSENLIESCIDQRLICTKTSTWDHTTPIYAWPYTFGSAGSYLSLPTLNAYSSMDLSLSLRTTAGDGLILYNAGRQNDFIAVEIVDGTIRYSYDLGNGPQTISVPGAPWLHDNNWHNVRITRSEKNDHVITVDGVRAKFSGDYSKTNLDLTGQLYIGGLDANSYYYNLPSQITSKSGYQGCLSNVDLNGWTFASLERDRNDNQDGITVGCKEPNNPCVPNPCFNNGICTRKWEKYTCDCSMTAYVGENCQQHVSTLRPENVATPTYRFKHGTIVYNLPVPKSGRIDIVTFGFSTLEKNCLLTRLDSAVVGGNFLSLTIEDGKVTLRYNVGQNDVMLQEPVKVSDGQYHTCVVRRESGNATMRVDNRPEIRTNNNRAARTRLANAKRAIPASLYTTVDAWFKSKEGRSIFNSQSMIQIGGIVYDNDDPSPLNRDGKTLISRPFRGQMMGFFSNDIRVFQEAIRNNSQVKIFGDVTLVGGPRMSPTDATLLQTTTTMATLTTFTTTQSTDTLGNQTMDDCDDIDLCSENSGSGDWSGDNEAEITEPQIASKPDDESSTARTTVVNENQPIDTSHIVQPNIVQTSTAIIPTEENEQSHSDSATKETTSSHITTKKADNRTNSEFQDIAERIFKGNNRSEKIDHSIQTTTMADTVHNESPTNASILRVQPTSFPSVFGNQKKTKPHTPDTLYTTSSSSSDKDATVDSLQQYLRETGFLDFPPKIATKPVISSDTPRSNVPSYTKPSIIVTKKSSPNPTLHRNAYPTTPVPNASNLDQSHRMSSTLENTKMHESKLNILIHTTAPLDFSSTPTLERDNIDEQNTGFIDVFPSTSNRNDPDMVGSESFTQELKTSEPIYSSSVKRKLVKSGRKVPVPPPITPSSSIALLTSTSSSSTFASSSHTARARAHAFTHPANTITVTDDSGSMVMPKNDQKNEPTEATSSSSTAYPGFPMDKDATSFDDAFVFAEKNTTSGSVAILAQKEASTTMIIGIAAAAALFILLLLFAMYRYKNRDEVYHVNQQEHDYGVVPTKGKQVVLNKNGSSVGDKVNISKQDKDKEYYV